MTRRCRRLMPPPRPYEIYARAAAMERRAVQVGAERQSERLRRLGGEIAEQMEAIADRRAAT